MTRKIAEKIIRGITDKIECNTADIDDWAEFWGFTRDEYEEFLDISIKALEQPNIKLTNSEWIDFLAEQFEISRTSAKEMLHVMMSVKREDNFKKQFSGRK